MFPSCPLSKHNTEPFDHKLLKCTVSIKSDTETHSRDAAQPPHSRIKCSPNFQVHPLKGGGSQTALPSFFSKFSRKKVPCKTHLSPALPLSNSTFCEMGWSLMRCTENGHVYPDCHLRLPLSAKTATTLLWYQLGTAWGICTPTKETQRLSILHNLPTKTLLS